jgi:hypothetical protein
MNQERKYSKDDIDEVLKGVGSKLAKPLDCYLIGGCAMTFYSLKPVTKDADVLFEDDLAEHNFLTALKKIGFEDLFPGAEEFNVKAKDILIGPNGLTFDLFSKTVMGGLTLNASMRKRAGKVGVYGKLAVYLAAKEDIYLFKAITNRKPPRDYEDLVTLQQSGLDWKTVTKEYETQIKDRDELRERLKTKLDYLASKGIMSPLRRALKT